MAEYVYEADRMPSGNWWHIFRMTPGADEEGDYVGGVQRIDGEWFADDGRGKRQRVGRPSAYLAARDMFGVEAAMPVV